jgi:phosphoribosyl-AMP cyclohydrolase
MPKFTGIVIDEWIPLCEGERLIFPPNQVCCGYPSQTLSFFVSRTLKGAENPLSEWNSTCTQVEGLACPKLLIEKNEPMLELAFTKDKNGLLPAIVQDYRTGEVLMLAYINKLAWERTLETGKAHYWSRSRNSLWLKGETSGHVQLIKDIFVDCDQDTVVFKVEQLGGAACHTGYRSCFYRKVTGQKLTIHEQERVFDPAAVYGNK